MNLNCKQKDFLWQDSNWIEYRRTQVQNLREMPLNIYEIDLASWRTRYGKSNREESAFLSYKEMAGDIVPYAKEMGYTHIAILPPNCMFDTSCEPDTRFGSINDFKYFVDALHRNGIGIILDRITTRKQKGDFYNLSSKSVCTKLILNILFLLEEYHIDGLRGEVNCPPDRIRETYDFFKRLNTTISESFPDVFTIAVKTWSENEAYVNECGFTFSQNFEMADELFQYSACDPYFRKYHHEKVLFSAADISTNYIIPISYAHSKEDSLSILDTMFGCYENKFAGFRALISHVMAFPGKKMLFMGSELGEFRKWDKTNQLEWFMLDYDMHRKLRCFISDINNLYLKTPELHGYGLYWINSNDRNKNVISYLRKNKNKDMVCVFNFSGVDICNYYVYVEKPGTYYVILNSDEPHYGGSGTFRTYSVHTDTDTNGGHYLSLNLAKLSGMLLCRADKSTKAVID